jgi:ubiquinone/menaquinone biosynthesis C-methylase UbiE
VAKKEHLEEPKRIVQRGYDEVAREYARLEGEQVWPRMRWLAMVLDTLEPGSDVLDLGCGSGVPADVEIAKLHDLTGVDISEEQIRLARENVPKGRFLCGDASALTLAPDSFDAVISFYTLEHIPRVEHAELLRKIHRWLRPGGHLLMSMEAGDYDDVIGHWLGVSMFLSCFPPQEMKPMVVEAGFEILETRVETQREAEREIPYFWLLARRG